MTQLSTGKKNTAIHSGWLRLIHALNAISILALASSGWAIYNAAPFYNVTFPTWLSLGGYLTEALRWHFTLAWIFSLTTIIFVGMRLLASRGGPVLRQVSIRGILADTITMLNGKLIHTPGTYNQLQRMAYSGVIILFVLVMISGLVLWKPIQLLILTEWLGGYENARRVHFWAMSGICLFTIVHVVMVLVVPRTLLAMLFGAHVHISGASNDIKK